MPNSASRPASRPAARPFPSLVFWMIAAAALQGCIAYTVASTAVSVTATAVETTVDVAAGAVDLVTPDGDDDD